MRKCSKCKVLKPLDKFVNPKQYYCRECQFKIRAESKEDIKKFNQKYWKDNNPEFKYKGKDHRKEYMREYMKSYREKYPHIQRSRQLLNDTLRRLGKHKTQATSKLLGYTAIKLKEHLDQLGMNWDTHQIDHKIPVSWFDKETPMHIINDLRNLQPLTLEENLEKSDKYCTLVEMDYLKIAKPYLI